MLLEGGDGSVACELRGIVKFVDVGDVAGVQGVFEETDDGGLKGDDLALKLILGDCCDSFVR